MSKMRTKIFGVIVTFVVFLMAAVLSLSLPTAQRAMAATGDISYLAPVYDTDGNVTFDENGNVIMQEKTIADGTYSVVAKNDSVWGAGTTATADENGEYWYVVNANVTRDSSLEELVVNGKVNLILCDSVTFNMSFDAINVSEGNELTVYGQMNGTGTLLANTNNSSNVKGAGIGGNITSPNAGKITVNGGVISARGATNSGAGIGGGNGGNGGEITINGGTVTATGGSYYGAGIGGSGGGDSGTIVINGGTINATAGSYSAAIGASSHYSNKVYGDCSVVRIYGGNVVANAKGSNAAAIGGSHKGVLEGVEIYGGEITTTNGAVGLGVGGYPVKGENEPYVTVYGGKINTTRIGQADSYTSNTFPKVAINIHGGEVIASSGIGSAKGDSGQITITGGKVIAYGGASNGYGHAAIGGGHIDMDVGGSGYVTISGGYIEAYGGGTRELGGGAGIGGAYKGHGIISISGACIIAEGGPGADGIGDGDDADPNGVHLEFGGSVGGTGGGSGSTPTPDNPDLEESQTVSTGAIIFTTGITGYSKENAANYTGIICTKYGETDVYSPTDYIFVDDIRIPSGYQLTIEKGTSLTLASDKTVTVEGELVVQGTFSLNSGAKIEKGAELGAVSSKKDGHRFDSWYTDEILSVPFVFGESVTEKITLFPKFVEGVTECNPDNGNIQILGISVTDIVFFGGAYNGYTGTPKVYVTDNGGTYYTAGVSIATHYEEESGKVLDGKPINAGNYALVFTFTDADDADSVNCTGSISYPFTIEKYTVTVNIDNQILDTTDNDLSSLNKTLTITYTSGVNTTHVAGYDYTVDFAWNTDRTGVILSNGRAVDKNGVDQTDNIAFVYTDALIMDYRTVTQALSSSTSTVSVPNKNKVTTQVGNGYIYTNGIIYDACADFCEWAYYIDSSYSIPLAESDLVGIYTQGNILMLTPEASQNTFTSNSFKLYYTITCNGYIKKSYYYIQRRTSTFTSIAIYKNGEEITGDRLDILNGATATYMAKALDQYGYEMTGKTIAWSISEVDGVNLTDGVLTVASSAQSRTITITSTSVTKTFELPVDLIGNECVHEHNDYGYCQHCQVKIAGATVTVGKDLTMTYSVSILDETLLADFSKIAMRFTVNGETVIMYAGGTKNGYYTFAYAGIAPQHMTDLIDAQLVLIDGESVTVLAEKLGYSVRQNAQNLLNKSPSAELQRLLTDMLYYGAEAQEYRGYNVEDLATDSVVGMANERVVLADGTDLVLSEKQSETTYFKSASVWFDNVNKLYVRIGGTADENTLSVTINGVEAESVDGVVYTQGILATDFDSVYTFALYENSVLVHTVSYSIKSYVNAKQDGGNGMAELASALYTYGKSAAAYAATLGS